MKSASKGALALSHLIKNKSLAESQEHLEALYNSTSRSEVNHCKGGDDAAPSIKTFEQGPS